jgi:hypothetical protein
VCSGHLNDLHHFDGRAWTFHGGSFTCNVSFESGETPGSMTENRIWMEDGDLLLWGRPFAPTAQKRKHVTMDIFTWDGCFL